MKKLLSNIWLFICICFVVVIMGSCNTFPFHAETTVKGKVVINLNQIPEYQNSELAQAVIEYVKQYIGEIKVENILVDFEKGTITVEYSKFIEAGE